MLSHNDDNTHRPDYFSVIPPTYEHFSVETPHCSPSFCQDDCTPSYSQHPLLASPREFYPQPQDHEAPKTSFMSMQTSAAHGSPRPRPYPMQNVLHVTSDDSTSSTESAGSLGSPASTPEFARCSRCQRTPSVDVRTGKSNMVQYGLNLWYCSRCATLVGLIKR